MQISIQNCYDDDGDEDDDGGDDDDGDGDYEIVVKGYDAGLQQTLGGGRQFFWGPPPCFLSSATTLSFAFFPCYFFLLPFLPDWKRMKTKLFLSDQMQSHIFTFPDLLGKTFMSVVEPDNIYMQ